MNFEVVYINKGGKHIYKPLSLSVTANIIKKFSFIHLDNIINLKLYAYFFIYLCLTEFFLQKNLCIYNMQKNFNVLNKLLYILLNDFMTFICYLILIIALPI